MAQEAVIRKLNPYELHGVLYYQMFLSYAETPDQVNEVRLAHDVVYPSPVEGDVVTVEKLLSIVTAVKKKEPQPG
jgi:hypothetical protein